MGNAPPLEVSDFGAFFESVRGVPPFPWQVRLARQVVTTGSWPSAIELPSGCGKTAALEVAVFHLAVEATQGIARRAPVRVAFVVDRLLVIDDAYSHACRLADVLGNPGSAAVVRRVAARLGLLAELPHQPLRAVRLRGGMPAEPDWSRTPAQPILVFSSVDQIGSRLFFRGYGVPDSMKPVHAGLLGVDTLFLLDEPHLSQPFVQTLRAAQELSEPSADTSVRPPGQIVTLSATPTGARAFRLTDGDRLNEHLRRRLGAAKPTQLFTVPGAQDSDAHLSAIAERALAMSAVRGGTCIAVGVVLNCLSRARKVLDRLERLLVQRSPGAADLTLLTGRSRELDREQTLHGLLARISASRPRHIRARPLVVVATQSVEVGADLDFDGLVTELAPFDLLCQRFGRLKRLGHATRAPGVILAAAGQLQGTASDPVYGRSLHATWALLKANATDASSTARDGDRPETDMGSDAIGRWRLPAEKLAPCLAPKRDAPVLLPAYLEAWAHTSPVPACEPDVALFLHGPESGPPDVDIVWRADLVEGAPEDDWKERVLACPPSSLEAMSVPISEARSWLRGAGTADIIDLEGAAHAHGHGGQTRGRPALRWRGAGAETKAIVATELTPGDRIVVPASRGGCDAWGWNPASTARVRDLGTEANARERGRDILRLSSELIASSRSEVDAAAVHHLVETLRNLSDDQACDAVRTRAGSPSPWRLYASREGVASVVRSERPGQEGAVLAFWRRSSGVGDAVTEEDGSVEGLRERRVLLESHSRAVSTRAAETARAAGVPEHLVADIAVAGLLHDAGQAHPRFRAWLCGGDPIAGDAAPALAKGDRRLGPDARARAGGPPGVRHELASLRYAAAHPAFAHAHDPELVLWLIGTHHGYGRPFFPLIAWPPAGDVFTADLGDGHGGIESRRRPRAEDVGSGWIDAFGRLRRRYGFWGLAWLEAVLRLADHRQSEAEREDPAP